MKTNLYRSKQALKHVLGAHFPYVIIILMIISWWSDMTLEVAKVFIKPISSFLANFLANYWGEELSTLAVEITIAIIMFCLFLLLHFLVLKVKPSDRFVANGTDHYRSQREILLLTLSGYVPRLIKKDGHTGNEKGYSFEEFERNLCKLDSTLPIEKLAGTSFQCNWLPALQAISHYTNIKEVVVFTPGGNFGSFGQIDIFKQFVIRYFSGNGRDINVTRCTNKMTDSHLRDECKNGIPDKNIVFFTKVILHVVDNIAKKEYKNFDDASQHIAIDITGGKSSMTAAMAAVSANRNIYMHYTDTNTLQSEELDITAT